MAAPRVSFGEKDMENGGDGAAERSRKWSQAPGNIEDLGEHTPSLSLIIALDATNMPPRRVHCPAEVHLYLQRPQGSGRRGCQRQRR
jgi:hypothetical protein